MECTDVQERLPWLISGSLDDDERRALESHLASCSECPAQLRAVREASALYAAHLPTEILVDYALGRPVEDISRDVLEEHLGHCSTCAEELELVRQDRVVSAEQTFGALTEPSEHGSSPLSAQPAPWRTLALAASVVAALGVGGLIWQSARAPAPSANVAVVELLPDSFVTRGGSATDETIEGARSSALIFVSDRAEAVEGARIRFTDPAGAIVWESDGLEATADGDFTVLVPANTLPRGEIFVSLETLRDGAWSVFESYRIDVSG